MIKGLSEIIQCTDKEMARLFGILDCIGDGISIQDLEYRILYQNRVHEGLMGNHVGEYCYKAYERSDKVCDGCPISKAIHDGNVHSTIRRVPDKDTDEDRYFENTASVLRDEAGQAVGAVEVTRDVSRRVRVEHEREQLIRKLEKALDEIKTLKGIIPICANCKSIRDDKGYWHKIELFIKENSDAEISHGLCPKCSRELYGGENWYSKMQKDDQTS